MKNKNSQVAIGQIFTYLIAIFIVAFVLLFGYKSIANLQQKGKEADYLQFKSQLESAVKLTKGYGDVTQDVLSVPTDYTEVCFVSYYSQTTSNPSSFPSSRTITKPLIENSVDGGVKKNVFLVKTDTEIDSFFIDNIQYNSADNFGCIPSTAGKLKIKLEGLGDGTSVDTFS